MRIAVDVRSLMEGRHSGVEEYTVQIIKAMAKVAPRHTFHLFTNGFNQVALPDFPANVVKHIFRYPNKFFNLSQLIFQRPRWNKLVGADVFFVTNARLVPLSRHVPLVTAVHDLSFERFPEFLDIRRRIWHNLMRPKLLLQNSDHIITVSENTRNDLINLYGLYPKKITTVYSGVTSGQPIRPSSIYQLRRKHKLSEHFILYFGALEPRKNIPSIIKAFTSIADRIPHQLVIAGETGWRQEKLQQAISSSNRRDKIKLLGFVPEEDKQALYAAADLFVYPSFYEGFGFPPLEALAAGTPVITSFNSSLPEIVGEWADLIDPYNPAQLAAVMMEAVKERRRISAEVQEKIREQYSWDTAARQTIKIIENVA